MGRKATLKGGHGTPKGGAEGGGDGKPPTKTAAARPGQQSPSQAAPAARKPLGIPTPALHNQ
eukprot:7121666-Alexandrium_andersonii.AAC.1